MARRYLGAVRYGLRHYRSVGALVGMVLVTYLGCSLAFPFFLSLLIIPVVGPIAAVALIACVHVAAGGAFLRYWLDALLGGLEDCDESPHRPEIRITDLLTLGLRGLGLYVVYALPVFTLPLLPLGMLALAYTGDGRAYDLAWAARAALRRPLQLAVLWLVLLLWALAMLVGLWGSLLLYAWLVDGHVGSYLGLLLLLPAVGLAATVGCVFATVIFRCIGTFGFFNPVVIEMLPVKPDARRTTAFVMGGIVASAIMQIPGLMMLGEWL